jgi:hypothetical protein
MGGLSAGGGGRQAAGLTEEDLVDEEARHVGLLGCGMHGVSLLCFFL